MTEDKMTGWHHRLDGHGFEQIPGDSEGQGSLVCCSPWGCKELDTTEQLNNICCLEVSLVAPPLTQETGNRFLSWDHALEKEMATHSNILALEIPWTEEAGGLQSAELQRVRRD